MVYAYPYMNFSLTQEQEAMRRSIESFVERRVDPVLAQHDRDRPLPKAAFLSIFEGLAELGLLGSRIPEAAGGSGVGMLDFGLMFEHIPASVGMSLIVQEACIARLYIEANTSQRKRFLPGLIAGEKIGCTGASEPEAGSDPRAIKTRLTREDGKLVLNGRKMWITNVTACDLLLVTCLDQREGAAGGKVVKVVIECDRSPIEARAIDTMGLRQGLFGEVVFENFPVLSENVIESERGGTEALKSAWTVNRPLLGLMAVHLAQKAYSIAVDHAKVRKQFGKVIAAHQLIQKTLSDIVTSITASRFLCYQALWLIDRGTPAEGVSAMAKRFAQNACREAVWQAMNVLGALGITSEARVEALYRDVAMIPIPDGTNELLALIHGRELTGVEAFRGTARTA